MNFRVLGASVRGPVHARAGEANQDAWFGRIDHRGALVVVADGMGSRPAARQGARAVVAACRDAWRHWSIAPGGSSEDLVRLIEVMWRLRLGATRPEDAASTCLVCAVRADGVGALLQLGDGLVGVCARGEFRSVTPERETFGSLTRALGTPHALRDWQIEPITITGGAHAVLLASDGVADDLLPERRADLVGMLIRETAGDASPRVALARMLRGWPVPRHADDKTLALLWEGA